MIHQPPSLQFEINRDKAAQDGVQLTDIFTALQGFYGSIQVNDYTSYGKNYKVVVQADDAFRQNADNLNMLAVRNSKGQMVSMLTTLRKIRRQPLHPSRVSIMLWPLKLAALRLKDMLLVM